MAANIGNTIDKSPLYAGVAAALKTGKTIVWGGALVKLNSAGADHSVLNMGDASITGFANGVLLFRDDDLSGTLDTWRLYVTDASNVLAANTAAGSAATTGTWQRIVWAIEILSTSSARVSLWLDNGTVIQNTGTYNNTGGLTLASNDLRIGARQQSAGDYRAMDGTIEDCFVCYGALPSAGELTALQTQSIRKVAATSSTGWTLHFHADLAATNMRDRISGTVPTVTTKPVMSFDFALDYGRGPTLCQPGDLQKNTTTTWPQVTANVSAAKTALNLEAFFTPGDNVDVANSLQCGNALTGFTALKAAGLVVDSSFGNHEPDSWNTRSAPTYESYLPPEFFNEQSGFVAAYDGTRYGTDKWTHAREWNGWLWLFLPWGATPEQWSWCRKIMHQHPEKPAAIIAHAFLNSSGQVYGTGDATTDQWAPKPFLATDAFNPSEYQPDLMQAHGIRAIFGGHGIYNQATQKTAQLTTTNAAGDDVLIAFCNSQETTNATDGLPGGDGIMWLIEFDGDVLRGQAWFARTNEVWTGSNSQFAFDVAPTHVQAHWKLDETSGTTFADSSGDGKSATMTGSPTLGSAGPGGEVAQAAGFDGVDDAATRAGITLGDNASVALWMRRTLATPVDSTKAGLAAFSESGDNTHIPWTDGKAYIGWLRGSSGANRVNNITLIAPVNRTEWFHVAVTTTPGANGWKFYIDGVLHTTATGLSSIGYAGTIALGKSTVGAARYFDGDMADVRLYDCALSPAEIAELVALGPPADYDVGLRAKYQLDEQAGTTLVDSSGNALNGTLARDAANTTAPKLAAQTVRSHHFNGSSDKGTVSDNAKLRLESWTLAGFVQFDSLPSTTHWTAIAGKGNNTETAGLNHNFAIGYDNAALGSGGAWFCGYEDSAGNNYFLRVAATPTLGQTYFLTATYDAVLDLLILYLDGVEIGRMTATATPDTGASTLSLGWADSATGTYLDGLIDEVRISGRALLACDVYALRRALVTSDANLLPILMQLAG